MTKKTSKPAGKQIEEIGYFDITKDCGFYRGIDFRIIFNGKLLRFVHYMRSTVFDKKRCKKLARNKAKKYFK
jgi:hypothetical protein